MWTHELGSTQKKVYLSNSLVVVITACAALALGSKQKGLASKLFCSRAAEASI